MNNLNIRNIQEFQPHFLKHDSLLNDTVEKSHYEKLYSLELEMKLVEEKMELRASSGTDIYENLVKYIYKKFETIDMLFTKMDYLDAKEGHDLLDVIDDKLHQLEEKIGTLNNFFKEH